MRSPRLRLYTKNISYFRMLQGKLSLCKPGAIADTEALIASYTGAKHAVLTSMGRMAIYEGLRALPRKGEIILSPITVPEVISLVILAGFTPVFCDVKPGTWNMDPELIEGLITERTAAIMTTHFFGNTNTTRAVQAICARHELPMIEDTAQALGAWNEGQHAGTVGEFGILSFSYPKNVTSFYGGCLITNNDELASKVREQIAGYPEVDTRWLHQKAFDCAVKDIATFGPLFQAVSRLIEYGYKHEVKRIINAVSQELNAELLTEVPARYRTRISPPQAQAIADKWKEVDGDAAHRIACAKIYSEILSGIPGLIMPEFTPSRANTYLYFPVQGKDKYAAQRYMIAHHCDVAVQHAASCADLEAYKPYFRDCPNARAAYAGTLTLPTYRGFPLAQARRYAQTLREYFT